MEAKTAHMTFVDRPCYLIRVGHSAWKFGDPYEICLVILDLGRGKCEIQGLDKPLLPSHWRAIANCLTKNGFIEARFERHRENGKIEWKTVHFK